MTTKMDIIIDVMEVLAKRHKDVDETN